MVPGRLAVGTGRLRQNSCAWPNANNTTGQKAASELPSKVRRAALDDEASVVLGGRQHGGGRSVSSLGWQRRGSKVSVFRVISGKELWTMLDTQPARVWISSVILKSSCFNYDQATASVADGVAAKISKETPFHPRGQNLETHQKVHHHSETAVIMLDKKNTTDVAWG